MKQLFKRLQNNHYQIWAHAASEGDLRVLPIDDFKSVDFSAKVPIDSWKQAFFPSKHQIFEFNGKAKETKESPKTALFGVRIFDLEAINLYDAVFADDLYYQERRKNILVIGFAPKDTKKDSEILFDKTFSEERLSHYNFDIFFDEKNKKYYCGSKLGGEIFKKLKIKPASLSVRLRESVGFPKSNSAASMLWQDYLKWKKVIEDTLGSGIWENLGKTCFACGKCSIACPTCFCFDIADEFVNNIRVNPRSHPRLPRSERGTFYYRGLSASTRNRCWGNCFYQEFHRVAINNIFNDNIKDRIAFWYFHKFVRIPKDYKLRGCVGCERCTQVCPVGINIKKILFDLKKQT